MHDEAFGNVILKSMRDGAAIDSPAGTISFDNNGNPSAYEQAGTPRPLGVEQSNVSIAFGDSIILKVYRRLRSGVQPEVEMARFLTNVGQFENMPAYLGAIEHRQEGEETTVLASAFEFVRNQGDAWEVLSSALQRDMENADLVSTAAPVSEDEDENAFFFPLNLGGTLGRRTAELHRALASDTDEDAFRAEKTGKADVKEWVKGARADLDEMMKALKAARPRYSDQTAELIGSVLDLRADLTGRLDACLSHTPSGGRSRIHGDYHLGQVLVAEDDVIIIDFEGEPRRSIDERRAKMSPLRDVAGMLRSIDYLAADAIRRRGPMAVPADDRAVARAQMWRDQSRDDFLQAYASAIEGSPTHPESEAFARDLLDLFLIQKAAYEVSYELANRPTWVDIPLRGLLALVKDNNGASS